MICGKIFSSRRPLKEFFFDIFFFKKTKQKTKKKQSKISFHFISISPRARLRNVDDDDDGAAMVQNRLRRPFVRDRSRRFSPLGHPVRKNQPDHRCRRGIDQRRDALVTSHRLATTVAKRLPWERGDVLDVERRREDFSRGKTQRGRGVVSRGEWESKRRERGVSELDGGTDDGEM